MFSSDPAARAEALTFVTRLQQTTGPLMAKAVEDTLFYRYNRLIALNEVGAAPDAFGASLSRFHDAMAARRSHEPHGLLATSTHDTKRGEDARARLYVLSERPEAWNECVTRWAGMNHALVVRTEDERAPSANDEWMFYQALAGAWPFDLDPTDRNRLASLADRMAAFMLKAIKEAKERTSWTGPDEPYEEAVDSFVRGTLDPTRSGGFLADFREAQSALAVARALNSLSQTLLKLTTPGVPDLYQGTELWDLSLVDPDNRRPVDYTCRRRLLAELDQMTPEAVWQRVDEGLPKLWVIRQALDLRRRRPQPFGPQGSYQALAARGAKANHVVAFARGESVVTVVPRLVLRLGGTWDDTAVELPAGRWRNELTGDTLSGDEVRVAELLKRFPVALLSRETERS